tara:strand:+ start:676 stop:939 length:264 start_codon:yes stop_codon:yes gene_type:complete
MDTKDFNNLLSFDYLNNLKKKILSLNETEYKEVYKIILNNNISHTKNSNGVFINLKLLNNRTIEEIESLLKYYDDYKKNINKIDIKD